MNKKGYTLIELLAVLAIMAAILLIAVPSITKQLTSIEENKYDQFKQNVYLAADAYISSNPRNYETLKTNNKSVCIDASELISGGWIKSTLKNPKTDEKINPTSTVLIKNCNGEYKYKYNPNGNCDDFSCGEA